MRLFHFYRVEDQTGVSGTGPVVEGVQFTNGWCALRWITNKSSICFYQSIEEVKAIHGHGGKTEIVIHDFASLDKRGSSIRDKRFEILIQIIEETSRINVLADEPSFNQPIIKESMQQLRTLVEELDKLVTEMMSRSA